MNPGTERDFAGKGLSAGAAGTGLGAGAAGLAGAAMAPTGEGPELGIELAGLRLKNPVIAASGCFGYGREYAGLAEAAELGAICTKGLSLRPREGNRGTRLHETPSGLMNSIGLENPGIEAFLEREGPGLDSLGTALIANLAGESPEDYAEGAALLSGPRARGVRAIELNISCPNVRAGGMAFGLDAAVAAELVAAVRARTEKPLIVKLSPNAPDLVGLALACEAAGADALSLVNTFSALAIDVERRRPVFGRVFAGLSGPAIRPLALRMVWEVAGAVRVPVVGMGGITTARDALEFLMAGARAVEVGSATFRDPGAMAGIIRGLRAFMEAEGLSRIEEIVGAARPRAARRGSARPGPGRGAEAPEGKEI